MQTTNDRTPPRADELVLHVGLAKTGTTAIQDALKASKPKLLEQGVLVPGDGQHHHLQSMFADHPHGLIQVSRLGLPTPAAEVAFIDEYAAKLEREILQASARRVVLSSEYIPAMNEGELARLGAYLRRFAATFRVVVYVRDPWSFSISALQQELRDGILSGPIRLGYRGDLRDYLNRLEAGFGQRPEVRLYASDSVKSFADLLGIELHAAGVRPNQSIGLEPACVLSLLNEIYPQFVDGVYRADGVRDWMVEAVCDAFPNAQPIRFSRQKAAEVYELASEDISEVSRRFFDGRSIFDDCYSQLDLGDGDDEISIARLSQHDLTIGLFRGLEALSRRALYYRGQGLKLKERIHSLRVFAEITEKVHV